MAPNYKNKTLIVKQFYGWGQQTAAERFQEFLDSTNLTLLDWRLAASQTPGTRLAEPFDFESYNRITNVILIAIFAE